LDRSSASPMHDSTVLSNQTQPIKQQQQSKEPSIS
jgi:hypothetical protein